MNFVAPYMLWGAAAAGIPVALHFFFRSRYRTVPWAAIKFLLTSVEQTSRRLKFQELLLLVVRCAVLALLALALARPLLSGVAASGKEAVDAVFVFDTSFSMGAREGKQTRLDFAKSAALAVIDHLPAHSTVQVVTCADHARLLGPREPGNLDQARALIKNLELTDLATDLAPGAAEAVSALARGSSPNKELYLFSDMQKLGWEQNGAALAKTLRDFSARGTVYLVACGKENPRNVAVVGIAPQSGLPRPGERVGFAVLVRNTGTVPVRNLRVTLAVDGSAKQREEQPLAVLEAGETRAVPLTVKLGKAGLCVLSATVRDDDLDADNRYDQVIQVRDQVRVLVVDGGKDEREPSRSSAYFLEHALLPVTGEQQAKYPIRLTAMTPRRVSADDLRKHDVCILVNVALERGVKGGEVPPPDFVERLGEFVRKGGGLIVFAGDHAAPEPYNRILGKRLGLLPLPVAGVTSFPEDDPGRFERKSIEAASLRHFREDEDYKGFGFVPVLRTLDLEEPPKDARGAAARVLIRYANGKPAVASRKADAGEVLFFATSAGPEWKPGTRDPSWNYLYLWKAGYIPLVHASLNYLLHRRTQNHNFTAGETLRWHPGPDPSAEARRQEEGGSELPDTRSFVLVHPPGRRGAVGRRVPLGRPEVVQGRPVVSAGGLNRAGVYYLTTADRSEGGAGRVENKAPLRVPFAVVPDLRESASLETLNKAQLEERLGFRPVYLVTGADVNVENATERTNQEWTLWLLAAVLALVVGEALLAWFCGRAW